MEKIILMFEAEVTNDQAKWLEKRGACPNGGALQNAGAVELNFTGTSCDQKGMKPVRPASCVGGFILSGTPGLQSLVIAAKAANEKW